MERISKDYYVETDRYNYILKVKKTYQDGKYKGQDYFVDVGYYGTLEALYKAILEREVKLFPEVLTSLESLIKLKNNMYNLKEVKL